MIVVPRGLCRALPALARKCAVGRPRGPAPPVAFEVRAGTLTAWVTTADAVLLYATSCPAGAADGHAVVPMCAVEAAAGPGDGAVELCVGPGLKGEARFADRGVPRARPFDAILPGKRHRPPDLPERWHPSTPDLLLALHECGRTAAKDAGRFALNRVQVRGEAGQAVATDGRTALVWAGLSFPFADDVLVPALPAFGPRGLGGERDIRVGLAAAHLAAAPLAVAAGPWRVLLPVDRGARYPDVAAVVPRGAAAAAHIDERDAADLLAKLPGLPGGDAEDKPVTLALGGGVSVWARDDAGATERVRLGRSSSAGPPARAVLDRRVLARALALGCLAARVGAEGKPAAFEGGGKTLVAMPLDPALAAGPPPDTPAHVTPFTPVTPATTERRAAVAQDTNGHAPHGRPDAPPADAPDPLAAAEELRAALADATAKAGLLVAALKSQRKEKRALTQVWSSLKALNLGGEGRP